MQRSMKAIGALVKKTFNSNFKAEIRCCSRAHLQRYSSPSQLSLWQSIVQGGGSIPCFYEIDNRPEPFLARRLY